MLSSKPVMTMPMAEAAVVHEVSMWTLRATASAFGTWDPRSFDRTCYNRAHSAKLESSHPSKLCVMNCVGIDSLPVEIWSVQLGCVESLF